MRSLRRRIPAPSLFSLWNGRDQPISLRREASPNTGVLSKISQCKWSGILHNTFNPKRRSLSPRQRAPLRPENCPPKTSLARFRIRSSSRFGYPTWSASISLQPTAPHNIWRRAQNPNNMISLHGFGLLWILKEPFLIPLSQRLWGAGCTHLERRENRISERLV
jgi:hypothetical protein